MRSSKYGPGYKDAEYIYKNTPYCPYCYQWNEEWWSKPRSPNVKYGQFCRHCWSYYTLTMQIEDVWDDVWGYKE